MTDLATVKRAIAENDAEMAASLARMETIRREGVARDLRAGRRVLDCHCDECLDRALRLELPNPRWCMAARAQSAGASLTDVVEIMTGKTK
jgi:hypothetical protein